MTNKKYKNILIVEVNWLGDVIFSTPFIRTIHEKFKDAKITCLLDERVKGALIHNPYIDDIIVYNEKSTHKGFLAKAKLISYLRKKHFDIAFILHRSFTKALIVFLSGIQERVGYDTKNRSFLLTKAVEVPEKPLHKVEYFLKIAETFGCMPSRKKYDFFVSKRGGVVQPVFTEWLGAFPLGNAASFVSTSGLIVCLLSFILIPVRRYIPLLKRPQKELDNYKIFVFIIMQTLATWNSRPERSFYLLVSLI